MQQQLRTSPVVATMSSLALLFGEFHKSEIRFSIPSRSGEGGDWFKFVNLFHPYVEFLESLLGNLQVSNKG